MTLEEAVSLTVKEVLQGDATLAALLGDGPGAYGAGVYHVEAPEGARYFDYLVYALVPEQGANPQGQGLQFQSVQVLVQAYRLGRNYPNDLKGHVERILGGYQELRSGYAISFEHIGGTRPLVSNIGTRRVRSTGSRFMARVGVAQ